MRYLSERDARKILLADLNELRYQREDMSLAQAPGKPGISLSLLAPIDSTLSRPGPSSPPPLHSVGDVANSFSKLN